MLPEKGGRQNVLNLLFAGLIFAVAGYVLYRSGQALIT